MSKIIDSEKEKEMSQNSKKKIIIGVSIAAVVAITFLAIVAVGMFRDFDAQKYVRSILNQTFKGEIEETITVVDGKTEEELLQQYEAGVLAFVENNVTSGIEMDAELKEKYVALCKEVFASMKYEVKEAEKISKKEYHVPVAYQTPDIFNKFIASLSTESARLADKADKGEYQGSVEEINAQMQNEFLNNAYELLKTAVSEATYAEAETFDFVVKADENGLFAMEDGQLNDFIVKIMGLDEIQD